MYKSIRCAASRFAILVAALLIVFSIFLAAAVSQASPVQVAPDFKLTGIDGKSHELSSFSRNKFVLFFFCGCRWCHNAASAWSAAQKQSTQSAAPVKTFVVYSGPAAEAREFEKQTGLDPAKTTIVIDPYMTVTANLYKAVPCPRAYVVSNDRTVLYTNCHADDAPRKATGAAIIAKVTAALGHGESGTGATSIAASQPVGDEAQAIFLTPLPADGVTAEGSGANRQAHYDFGTVSQSKTKTVEHIFQFRNDTAAPLSIDHIQPSCGCTNAFVGDSDEYPVVVQPGATVNVTAYVDLTDLYPAEVDKSVMIFRTGQITPTAAIDITGNLTQ